MHSHLLTTSISSIKILWSQAIVVASEKLKFMQLAIMEGRKAIPKCADNPPVGCVLVQNGRVVAQGHTNSPGNPHAEAMAISLLKNATDDVVAFVTLEPCSFKGRTPSCAQTLIDAGVKTVYVGILDPDPRNNGQGIEKMRASGINVEVGILAQEIIKELGRYLGKAP
jgi:pyrimidine deaminase RibD-like protein